MTNNIQTQAVKEQKTIIKRVELELLRDIDRVDRSEWTYEMYVHAGGEARLVKEYSQWMIGKLATEVMDRFKQDEDYAEEIGIPVNSLRTYRYVYQKFTKENPDFIPEGYLPWGVLQMAAATDNPIETLNSLQDKDANTISKAYRVLKEEKTGQSVPIKPKLAVVWDEEKSVWKVKMRLEDIPKIDWSDIATQLTDYLTERYQNSSGYL